MVNMDGRYNIVDLFCGVGGLSLGFNLNGYKTIFANDIDKDASNTFKLNHPDVPFLQRDIAKIVTEEILQIIGIWHFTWPISILQHVRVSIPTHRMIINA